MNRLGAPTKLTPAFLDELLDLIRQGNSINDAIAAKGVNLGTWRRWRQRASERPGSIYGEMRARMDQAVAEASAINVAILTRASTVGAVTRKVVTKRERVLVRAPGAGDDAPATVEQLLVTEEVVTETTHPAEAKWAAWKLERMNREWQPRQAVEAVVANLPPEVMNRSMGELLRIAQGGDGPSRLRDDDDEARQVLALPAGS